MNRILRLCYLVYACDDFDLSELQLSWEISGRSGQSGLSMWLQEIYTRGTE